MTVACRSVGCLVMLVALGCPGPAVEAPRPAAPADVAVEPPPPAPSAVAGRRCLGLALGTNFGCLLVEGGTVRCWGRADDGQLGEGAPSPARCRSGPCRTVPVPVAGLDDAAQVVAGAFHACALRTGGTVCCWGRNDRGQIGDGTTVTRWAPAAVEGLPEAGVVELAAGGDHTCARDAQGGVWCWGANDAGELGDGTTEERHRPVAVVGLDGRATQVAAAAGVSCAVLDDATARCWGNDDFGTLGDGGPRPRPSQLREPDGRPVRVLGLERVRRIVPGPQHACALLEDSTVACWGHNAFGEVGDGTEEQRRAPVPVPDLNGVVQVALTNYQTCALLADGTARCWGIQDAAQLGPYECPRPPDRSIDSGSPSPRCRRPTPVAEREDLVEIAFGSFWSCQRARDGAVVSCQGSGDDGTVGDAGRPTLNAPATLFPPPYEAPALLTIPLPANATCGRGALLLDGWAILDYPVERRPVPPGRHAVEFLSENGCAGAGTLEVDLVPGEERVLDPAAAR